VIGVESSGVESSRVSEISIVTVYGNIDSLAERC